MQQAVRRHEQTEAQRAAAQRRQQQELKCSAERQVQAYRCVALPWCSVFRVSAMHCFTEGLHSAYRDKQAGQTRRKLEDEHEELRETQRLLGAEREAAEAAKQALAREHERVRAENMARIAAKHAEAEREKAEDRVLMEETMRTLEKQAADRAQATKDFHVRTCTSLSSTRAKLPARDGVGP